MSRAEFEPQQLLLALRESGAAFIVIGGWAAGVHGVGWTTFDLDVVVASEEENLERVLTALIVEDAVFHTAHRPPIRPDMPRLVAATGPLLFRTKHGRLDVLKEAGGETYESLALDAGESDVAGHTVRIASLAALVRMKRAANRPKDRAVLPAMEAALAQRIRS